MISASTSSNIPGEAFDISSLSSSSSVFNCIGRPVVVLNGANVISNEVAPMLPLSPIPPFHGKDESSAIIEEEDIPFEFTGEKIITVSAASILHSKSAFLAASSPSVPSSSSSSTTNERLPLKDQSKVNEKQKHRKTQDREDQKRCRQERQDRVTHLKERIQTFTKQHAKKEAGPSAIIEREEALVQSKLTMDPTTPLVLPAITASAVSIIGSAQSELMSPASSFSTSSSSSSPKSKKQEKRVQNKVSAQQYRQRQKEYRVGLEKRLKKYEKQNTELLKMNAELQAKNEELLRMNAELQAKVKQCMAEVFTASPCTSSIQHS